VFFFFFLRFFQSLISRARTIALVKRNPDTLSKRAQNTPDGVNDNRKATQEEMLFKEHQLKENLLAATALEVKDKGK